MAYKYYLLIQIKQYYKKPQNNFVSFKMFCRQQSLLESNYVKTYFRKFIFGNIIDREN